MLNILQLRKYAQRLITDSDFFSPEEKVGEYVLELLDASHCVESVLDKLSSKYVQMQQDEEDTETLQKSISYIKTGKK